MATERNAVRSCEGFTTLISGHSSTSSVRRVTTWRTRPRTRCACHRGWAAWSPL